MSELVDAIYEAAVLPVQWPDVLAKLATEASAFGGVLFSVTDVGAAWTCSPSMLEAMTSFVATGWAANNSRMARGLRKGLDLQPRFVGEIDYDETGSIYKDPVYTDFFIPKGLGQSLGTIAPLPHGDMLCFSFERAFQLGQFEAPSRAVLDAHRPHLMRAATLTARLGMERIRSSVETLAQLGYPAAALDRSGRVIIANEAFSAADVPWTTRARDRLALDDPKAAGLLSSALDSIGRSNSVGSIPLRKPGQPTRLVLHLLPVRKLAQDIFTNAVALVAVTGVRAPAGDPAVLQVLFDLTHSEAILARRLAAGGRLEQIASDTGRSISTLRNQLSTLLAKTGCSRQAELSSVLNALILPSE